MPTLFDLRFDNILPGHLAPGPILNRDGDRELVPMQFGLAKIGSENPFDRKWPNNNARIKKYDSWPWKLPFKDKASDAATRRSSARTGKVIRKRTQIVTGRYL